jgi:rhamnosyltransferase
MMESASILVSRDVCAVIVTFHPDDDVFANVERITQQVDEVLVVDNGSTPAELASLYNSASRLGFSIIANGDNLGIATALNAGIRWAEQQGFCWIIFFDQDSTVTDGFIDSMMTAAVRHVPWNKMALFYPKYVDRRSGKELKISHHESSFGGLARTSGSLIPMHIFRLAGHFVDEMFIDQVDYEFCFRLKRLGYHSALCPDASLVHSLGEWRQHKVLGLTFTSTHHSALRKYYLSRNRVWMVRHYWRLAPAWCARTLTAIVKDSLKILALEDQPWEKLKNVIRGVMDGLIGRMGRRLDL